MNADFDLQEAFTRVHDRITDLHTDVTITKTKVEALVGNGQPGEIKLIKDRVTALEEVRHTAKGYLTAVAGISTVLGVFGHYIVDLFRSKH